MDTSKELCADNRHRLLLHTSWGIRRVALPIFGPVIEHAEGRVRTKRVLEMDHVLADFRGRFLPTLGDFVREIADELDEAARFEEIRRPFVGDDEAMALLLSPFGVTGCVRSLLVTHNTWFLSEMLPPILRRRPAIAHGVRPDELFARMAFRLWMDNGSALPPSAPREQRERDACM
jgi:hypothetical protein